MLSYAFRGKAVVISVTTRILKVAGLRVDTGFTADRHSQLAGLDALIAVSADYSATGPPRSTAAPGSSHHDLALAGVSSGLLPERLPDANETTDTFLAALNSVGPRQSRKLHDRPARRRTPVLSPRVGVHHRV